MARKEVVVEDAVRLMRNPKNIRNMGIVAHVDHGKCISGKTRLVLTNGHTMDAKALYESIQTNGIRVQKTDSETVYAPQTPAHVFSLNKTTGRIEEKPLTLAWKLNGGPVKTLTLRNGLQVTTTPEHKFIVLSNLSFAEKQAGELRIGAWVVCPKKLEVQSSMDLRSEIFEQLSHRNDVYFILKPEFAKWLHETNELQPLMADAQTKLAKAGFKGCLKRGRFKASDLANICKAKGIPFSLAYERISGVFYRAGGKKGKNGKIMKLPSKFEDFFYLAGLLFGDGSRDKLVVGKPELEVEFVRILNDLGITPVCREYSGKTKEISAGSKTLLAFLELFFDYPQKKKSHNIRCSDFLVRAPASCVAAFLRGHFDCDGTVEKSRGAVSITCVSPAMLSGIQLLLLRFNVASNRQGDTLYISGNSISRFNEHIGFLVSEKKAKAAKLESRAVGSYALDVIPLSANALKSAKGVRSMTSVANNFYEYANQKTRPTIGSMMKISQKLSHEFLAQLCSEELMFVQVKNIQDDVEPEVYDFTVEDNHNFVAEGMFIHNTTLSDSLVARAGLISKELAGEQRVLDFDEQEQARGITIKAANITLGFSLDGKEYLINLIDTPGHVDFGGHVTRAMRAVDGAIIVVDSVEGIMPQTETVLRQALKEKVRPVLFINKIDRLMNELKLDSKGMQDRFLKVITGVNKLIDQYGPEEFKNDWKIEVAKGNVAFGSGFYKWAVSAKTMKKFNITFKDMYDMCVAGDHKKLQQKAPLDDVILSMVIEHLPSPVDAQKYRIP
ncbi:GTP-binding protein, partial [Candidatus Micrarchaeota archaeon]|nr:GTP-binding protein [Candidatus Micrarchaeota archaeon]